MSVTRAMDVTYLLLLGSLGLAITAEAQDCSSPVAGSNMGFKDVLPGTFPNGLKVSLECNVGYQSAGGSSSITCADGTWSPVRLICQKKNCGNAGEVQNGDVYYEGTEFGDQVTITCKSGYHLVGNGKRTCGDKGWLGRMPTCEAVACSTPEPLTNGFFGPVKESYIFSEVVQYECQKDYTMSGSRSSSCSADGTFKPAPPTCILVECEELTVKNGEWASGSRPPYKHQSTVTLQCLEGHTMKGPATQRCDLNSQWVPGLPTCERESETVDPPGNNGNPRDLWLGLGLTVLIGSVLTVLGCYCCGVPACIKDKKRSWRSVPENVTPKADEEVALS